MMGAETPSPDSEYHSTFLFTTPNSPSPSTMMTSSSPPPSPPQFHITVSDPQKEVDPTSVSLIPSSPSSFFTYLITTTIRDVTPASSSTRRSANNRDVIRASSDNNHQHFVSDAATIPNNLDVTSRSSDNKQHFVPDFVSISDDNHEAIDTSSDDNGRHFVPDFVTLPTDNHDVTPSNGHQRSVDIPSSTSSNSSNRHSVRRRFRDVVTLADRLADSHRGLFIPLRPDKSLPLDSQSPNFVENRRLAIEKYLRRLAAHPVIGKSDELRVFLFAKGKLPLPTSTDVASRMLDGAVRLPKQLFGDRAAAQVAVQEVVQPAKGGRDLLRIFKEIKQAVVTDWAGVRPMVVEEDKEFLEKKGMLQELEVQLGSASQQAEGLVKAQQDFGETMSDLGMAFIKLTKFETEEAVYDSQRICASDTKHVATAAVKASRLYRELNSQTVKHLDILHEYLGVMLAVQGAFAERASALLTVQTLMSDLSSFQTRAEKHEVASSRIFGGDKSRLRKVDELRETIRVTEDAKNCAIREYERIKENNRNELERVERERHEDFLSMLKGFVINQVAYSEKIADVWTNVAEESSRYA